MWWFSGGFDLTPTTGNVKTTASTGMPRGEGRRALFGADVYRLPEMVRRPISSSGHRAELRGIGGLFFDG